jgi:tRNA (cytidine/uridine-2'-O-)-methyltransferase
MYGPESVGLPPEIQRAPEITDRLKLPMMPATRSLNLANTVAISVYEAWRQQGFRTG